MIALVNAERLSSTVTILGVARRGHGIRIPAHAIVTTEALVAALNTYKIGWSPVFPEGHPGPPHHSLRNGEILELIQTDIAPRSCWR